MKRALDDGNGEATWALRTWYELVHLPWALSRESLPALLQVGHGSCAWSRVSQICLGCVLLNSRNFALHGTQLLRLAFSPSQGPAFLAEPEVAGLGADATPTVLFVSAAPVKIP